MLILVQFHPEEDVFFTLKTFGIYNIDFILFILLLLSMFLPWRLWKDRDKQKESRALPSTH